MTNSEMLAYFDLLTDKVGTAYWPNSEKYTFLNNGQNQYLKGLLPSNEGGVVNMELDHITYSNVYTLIFETAPLTMNGTGEITKLAVQTALNAASSSTEPWVYVMAVSASGLPVRYTRQNNWYEEERNSFKKGTATKPKYKQLSTKFVFAPVDTTSQVKFTLLKEPKQISDSTSSDFPNTTHETIVQMAVDLAIRSIRDREYNEIK